MFNQRTSWLPLCAAKLSKALFARMRRSIPPLSALLLAGATLAGAQDAQQTREFRALANHVP